MALKMQPFFAVLVALLAYSSPSAASSWITVTRCETVEIGGQSFPKITFDFTNRHTSFVACVLSFQWTGEVAEFDSCSAIQCTVPPGMDWSCGTGVNPLWTLPCSEEDAVDPGQTISDFSVVLTRGQCCFNFFVSAAIPSPFHHELICFDCPVPTSTSTWGGLKSIYR